MNGQGVEGFKAGRMDGQRRLPRVQLYRILDNSTPGNFSHTVPEAGWADVFWWGGGGSGRVETGGTGGGGGGGGGARRRLRVRAGQVIHGSIGTGGAANGVDGSNGNPGGDTIVIFPDGLLGIARGGAAGNATTASGGGYQVTGDMTGSIGGVGGATTVAGSAGSDGGGTGGAGGFGTGGGGGAAGFESYTAGLNPGAGGFSPGLGAGSSGNTGGNFVNAGGNGRLLIYFIRE